MNLPIQQHFAEIPMPKPKKTSAWGHQVATRFTAADLKKLDKLVRAAEQSGSAISATGMHLAPSRSSVIINLVRDADIEPSTKPDPRQVDLEEAIERSKLALDVDRLEASSLKLDRKAFRRELKNVHAKASKKKAPRGAPKKRRAAKTFTAKLSPKRRKQIAAAKARYAAKQKKARR